MVSRTGIGAGIGIPFKNNALKGDKPYLPPEIKDSLKAVVIAYGKTNNDSDRAIVKNLVDPDNPFVISNAAFKLNSGFGEYAADFLDWTSSKDAQKTSFEVKITSSNYKENWVAYKAPNTTFKAMKVRISGIPDGGYLQFFRTTADGGGIKMVNGINEIPAFTSTVVAGFYIDIPLGFDWSNLVIEQIPSFQGAFVTDGINDLIKSTKSATEMLDGSNEVTVVSMIHQIKTNSDVTRNNWFFTPVSYLENRVVENKTGKTGIYGYTSTNVTNAQISDITPILGDKNDYTLYSKIEDGDRDYFTVEGFQNQGIWYVSSIAWYWTIIANKVLTTDQINQVIAYFNLDRTLKPDILCNTIKQGITNENHAEFGDKLIDFSGNGRDIQLNNLAWKGGSGIAAKQYETFKDWTNTPYQTSTVTEIDEFTRVVDSTSNSYWVSMINRTSDFDKVHDSINIVLYQDDMLLVHECKYKIDENVTTKALYETLKSGVNTITLATIDKFTDIPEDAEIMSLGEWVNPKSNKGSVKITLLPSYEGGVLLDGINDFGKVTGMPIYKDYTFIIDYERISYTSKGWGGAIVSKSPIANNGAFISMMANSAGLNKQLFSFGGVTAFIKDDLSRILFWQTKYKSENTELTVGEGVDGDTLWLGTLRDNDSRFFNGVIYSLMSFPYSMSEFLIERQLKKHKLGTLYPDMVEFRPVIKTNTEWEYLEIYQGDNRLYNLSEHDDKTGIYLEENSSIEIYVKPYTGQKVSKIVYNGTSYIDLENNDYGYYYITVPVTKSPQKIGITIEWDEGYLSSDEVHPTALGAKAMAMRILCDIPEITQYN